jgi:hypothetical protein
MMQKGWRNMSKFRKSALSLLASLVLLLLLAACGNSAASSTPANTSPAAVATTTSATTTSTSVATTAATTDSTGLPTFKNVSKVSFDSDKLNAIKGQLQDKLSSVPDLQFGAYTSSDDLDTLAKNADATLTGAGYRFGIPGSSAPVKQDKTIYGFYAKSGVPDLYIMIGDPNVGFGLSGMEVSDIKALLGDGVSNSKGLMLIYSGTDLINALKASNSSNVTATASANANSADKAVVPTTYPNAVSIPLPASAKPVYDETNKLLNNAKVDAYKSTASLTEIKDGVNAAFAQNNWIDDSKSVTKTYDSLVKEGAFVTGFHSGQKIVTVIAMPTAMLGGEPGFSEGDSIILVMSGDKR